MSATPVAGTVWVERSSPHRVPGCRRAVQVTEADESFVYGVGFWQEQKPSGLWTDCVGPGSHRKTRVRTHLFAAQYDRLDGPEEP